MDEFTSYNLSSPSKNLRICFHPEIEVLILDQSYCLVGNKGFIVFLFPLIPSIETRVISCCTSARSYLLSLQASTSTHSLFGQFHGLLLALKYPERKSICIEGSLSLSTKSCHHQAASLRLVGMNGSRRMKGIVQLSDEGWVVNLPPNQDQSSDGGWRQRSEFTKDSGSCHRCVTSRRWAVILFDDLWPHHKSLNSFVAVVFSCGRHRDGRGMFVLPLRHIIAVGESPVKIMLSRDYYEMRALISTHLRHCLRAMRWWLDDETVAVGDYDLISGY